MTALRSLVFVAWMYGTMVMMGLVCAPSLLLGRRSVRACQLAWLGLTLWGLRVFCGVRWEVRGREHIPQGPALIALKHQSMFDTLAPWKILPDPAIILKKELTWLPVFGWYAMRLKNVAVDRASGAAGLRKMVRDASALAAEGRQVLIFPEGTRTPPGERAPYKPGVAALYREMSVPCTPVALNSGLCWPARGFVRTPGVITLEFLPPIPPGRSRAEFMAELEDAIETASVALLPASLRPNAPAAPRDKPLETTP